MSAGRTEPAESSNADRDVRPGAPGDDPAAHHIESGLTRAGALTYGFNVLILVTNLVSGVLTARVLGTTGRGELVAILTIGGMLGWAFAMGGQQAASYHQARHPADGGRLVATWLVVLLPIGVVAVLVGEALLPVLFSAQTPEAIELARIFIVTAVLVLLFEFFSGVVLGDHDFLFFNVLLLAQPAVITLAYIVLWSLGWLSVESALAVWALSLALVLAAAVPRVLRRHRLRRPDMALAKSTFSYGIRAHGTRVGGLANQRLDLFIIPAFVAASQVGLYSVASNVSFIIVTLAGALYPLVLPAAARLGERGPPTVILSLQVTLIVALVLALAVGVFADIAVRLVYGDAFADSVLPLQLLLPGSVFYAGARVLASGLYAANRPFTATVAETAGVVVTVIGLVLFLGSGGIVAAALVTSVSYTIVFFAALLLYRRATGLEWRAFVYSARVLPEICRSAWARRARGGA